MSEPIPSRLSVLRDVLLGAVLAFVGFNVVVATWGLIAAYVSLPVLRWLSVNGHLERDSSLQYLAMYVPDVLGVLVASVVLAYVVGRFMRTGWRIVVCTFVVTLFLTVIDWSPEAEHRFFALSHWLFWVFSGCSVATIFLISRWRAHHAA